jgi:hypothetical protein
LGTFSFYGFLRVGYLPDTVSILNPTFEGNTNPRILALSTFTNNVTVRGRAPNIIDQMAAQSIINSRAFGLTLGNGTEGNEEISTQPGRSSKWNRIYHLRWHRHLEV